jgi:hypothetical protein
MINSHDRVPCSRSHDHFRSDLFEDMTKLLDGKIASTVAPKKKKIKVKDE